MNYKDTILWKKTLGNKEYTNDKLITALEEEYEKTRDNAEYILGKIREDFPNLTVHDISHVDSLWQVGSVIVGNDYLINPLEGYVLGCAFVMHDAVLSYEAAGGVSQLRNTIEWRDIYADYERDSVLSDDEKKYEADFRTIRYLHAKYAETLYEKLFIRNDKSSFYLIENKELRKHLGEVICQIASSHHKSVDEIERIGVQLAAPSGYPQEWRINPLKLACILRCADAGHIDAGRAPDYLFELLKVNGLSRNHWIAQNRLSQIDTDEHDRSKVVITSNISFREEDFAAWNVAYDAVCVLNYELMESNKVLQRNNTQEFQAKSVSGAESQEALSQYIKTSGWMPCDAEIHISDVESLISNLGGENLYGKEHKLEVVIRELVQNARDSIEARRKIDPGFKGEISIEIYNDNNEIWVEVRDDGLGMSIDVIKRHLLNFGSSFWASDLAKQEFPGLNSSGFQSVGKFGIGFYSVFMVASKVIIETRKFDKGLDENSVIKFLSGLSLRPIVSVKRGSPNVSTSVRFSIDESKYHWDAKQIIKAHTYGDEDFEVPYSAVLANLVAGLDVNVFYKQMDKEKSRIHKNITEIELESKDLADWLKDITFSRYRSTKEYVNYIDENYSRARRVISKGKCYGIAALNNYWTQYTTFFDVQTVGGLSTFGHSSDNGDYLGCLILEPDTAKRDGNVQSIDMSEWAKDQLNILHQDNLNTQDKLYFPYILGKYNIDLSSEMLVRVFDKSQNNIKMISLSDLLKYMYKNQKQLILPLSSVSKEFRIEHYIDYSKSMDKLHNNELLFISERNSGFLCIDSSSESFPLNLMQCIKNISSDLSLDVNVRYETKRIASILTGLCNVCVVSLHEKLYT